MEKATEVFKAQTQHHTNLDDLINAQKIAFQNAMDTYRAHSYQPEKLPDLT
jgi:hypothetical protein